MQTPNLDLFRKRDLGELIQDSFRFVLQNARQLLTAILLYHVVNDRLTRDQLATDDLVPTLSGGRPLFVNSRGGQILNISGAMLLVTDIQASNGIIHVIDRVMIP